MQHNENPEKVKATCADDTFSPVRTRTVGDAHLGQAWTCVPRGIVRYIDTTALTALKEINCATAAQDCLVDTCSFVASKVDPR